MLSSITRIITSADYYPFGWRMPDRVSIGGERYRFGYQGQFSEYDEETGYNHFEARLLDTRIGRWLATDPVGQFFSPYVSMGNNPINGVDPDGRKVRFAKGASRNFKQAFRQAIRHLRKHDLDDIYKVLRKSKETYFIKEGHRDSKFYGPTKTITWDPRMGLLTTLGHRLSPTTLLDHEFAHAASFECYYTDECFRTFYQLDKNKFAGTFWYKNILVVFRSNVKPYFLKKMRGQQKKKLLKILGDGAPLRFCLFCDEWLLANDQLIFIHQLESDTIIQIHP